MTVNSPRGRSEMILCICKVAVVGQTPGPETHNKRVVWTGEIQASILMEALKSGKLSLGRYGMYVEDSDDHSCLLHFQ